MFHVVPLDLSAESPPGHLWIVNAIYLHGLNIQVYGSEHIKKKRSEKKRKQKDRKNAKKKEEKEEEDNEKEEENEKGAEEEEDENTFGKVETHLCTLRDTYREHAQCAQGYPPKIVSSSHPARFYHFQFCLNIKIVLGKWRLFQFFVGEWA